MKYTCFEEYMKANVTINRGLAGILYDINYKHTCVKPEKTDVSLFAEKSKIQTPVIIHTGNIKDPFPAELPESYCLKPIDGAGSRGVFLMHNGVNLKDGKVYSEEDIRTAYIKGSTVYVGYSDNYYVEELLLSDGRIPDDYNFFMIEDKVGCVLRVRKFMTDTVTRVFYDDTGREVSRTGGEVPPLTEEMFYLMKEEAVRIMNLLKNPCMRVDLYFIENRGVFLGELTAASGVFRPDPSASFLKMDKGLLLDKYMGYLLSQVDLSKYDETWRLKNK